MSQMRFFFTISKGSVPKRAHTSQKRKPSKEREDVHGPGQASPRHTRARLGFKNIDPSQPRS